MPQPTDHRSAKVVGVTLAVAGGFGGALQSRINGTLAAELHSGFAAAVISFGTGLLVLVLVVLVSGVARRALAGVIARLRDGGLRWWECLGGAGGGFYVATQGLTVGALGVAAFTVAVVAGQSVSSLAVDRLGLAPGGVRLLTMARVAGPVLTVVAVSVAMSGQGGSTTMLALAVLPFLAGTLQSVQQAFNGRVRAAVEHPARSGAGHGPAAGVVAATFLNFVVGTLALLVAFAASVAVQGWPDGTLPSDLWLYTGGLIGIVFIGVSAAVVHRIGVLLLGLGMIAGQVVGALVIDVVAPDAAPPGLATYVGAALTLVAVAVPALEGLLRRRR